MAIAFGLVLLYSCNRDQLDFSNANVVLEPTIIAPIMSLEMNLENMAEELDDISTDSSGNLLVYYRDNSAVPPLRATDLLSLPPTFGIPNAQFPMGTVKVDPIDINENTNISSVGSNWEPALYAQVVALNGGSGVFPGFTNEVGGIHTFPAPTNFSNGNVANGFLQLELTNQWPIDLQNVDVILKEGGVVLGTFNFPAVSSGMSGTSSISLSSLNMGNSFTIEVTSMSSGGSVVPVPVDLNDELEWDLRSLALEINEGDAVLPDQTIFNSSSVVDISLPDEEISLLELLEGGLEYDLTSNVPQPTMLVVTFIEGVDASGDTLRVDIPIDKNGSTQGFADLSNGVIRLDQNASQPFNRFTLSFEVQVVNSDGQIENILNTQSVSGSLNFNDFEFKYVEGFFGSSVEDLTGNELNLDLEFLDRLTGEFYLEDPIIKLLTDNALGVPVRTNFDLIGTNKDGNVVPLNLQPNDISYPTISEVGVSKKDEVLIDRTTSNIVNFLGNIPEVMAFDGSIDINPDGNTGTNFLTNTGRMYIGVEVNMGLNLRVDDLGWTDTLDLSLELDNDQIEPKTLILHGNVDNGFGLDADFKLLMISSASEVMDSVEFNFMKAGVTDSDGFVIESTFTENRIELNESQTESLFNTDRLVLSAKLNSPNDGVDNYVMNVTDFLKIYLAIESKIQINVNAN